MIFPTWSPRVSQGFRPRFGPIELKEEESGSITQLRKWANPSIGGHHTHPRSAGCYQNRKLDLWNPEQRMVS